jgi:hypothetical protein
MPIGKSFKPAPSPKRDAERLSHFVRRIHAKYGEPRCQNIHYALHEDKTRNGYFSIILNNEA